MRQISLGAVLAGLVAAILAILLPATLAVG